MIGKLILFGLAVCLAACSQPQSFSVAEDNRFQNESDATNYREAQFLKLNPTLARRQGDTLILYLLNGKTRVFQDMTLERCERETPIEIKDGVPHQEIGSCVEYFRVVGYWPQKSWFLIEKSYYEGGNALVVNSRGDTLRIGGLPTISPDSQKMYTYDAGCGLDEAFIQIWDVAGDLPRKLYESGLSGRDYGEGQIFHIRWDGRNRLTMTAGRCEDDHATTSLHLERHVDGHWVWSGIDPYKKNGK